MVEHFREEIKTYDREARQVLNKNENGQLPNLRVLGLQKSTYYSLVTSCML